MPDDQINNFIFLFLLTVIMMCWLSFILFIRRTMRAPIERRKQVLKKMITILSSFRGYWERDPEKEADPRKREIKRYKMFLHVRLGMVIYAIGAVIVFLIGLTYNLFWFQIVSLIGSPIVGLMAVYFWFLYYLMKDVEYFDKSLLPD